MTISEWRRARYAHANKILRQYTLPDLWGSRTGKHARAASFAPIAAALDRLFPFEGVTCDCGMAPPEEGFDAAQGPMTNRVTWMNWHTSHCKGVAA